MTIKPLALAAFALGLPLTFACAEKKLGRRHLEQSADAQGRTGAPVDENQNAPAEDSVTDVDEGLGGVVDDDDQEDGETGAEPEKVPAPDSLVRSEWYRVVFDAQALRGIRDGRGYRDLGVNLANSIRERLVTQATDGMLVTETYGDGKQKRVGTRELVNSAMDKDIQNETTSFSGVRKLDETASDPCPAGVLCVSRLVLAPFAGEPKTLCFTKPGANEAALYPYGATPAVKAADLAGVVGEHGPYLVRAYAGKDVNCAAPETAPVAEETMGVTVTTVAPASLSLTLHKVDPMAAQIGVAFEHHRTELDLMSPYSDETIGLDHRTQYFVNADAKRIVAMIVTSRQSINVAQAAGGGLLGGLIGLFNNIDGITIDQRFELCQDMLDEQAPAHCLAAE